MLQQHCRHHAAAGCLAFPTTMDCIPQAVSRHTRFLHYTAAVTFQRRQQPIQTWRKEELSFGVATGRNVGTLTLSFHFLAIIKCETLFHQILKVRTVCTHHSFYPDRLTVLLHTPIIVQFSPNKNMGTWL